MISYDDFLKKLSESNNKILISNSKDIGLWKGLKHNKEGLELFLNHNIAEVSFKTGNGDLKTIIACSSTPLIKMFSLKKGSNYKKQIDELSHMKSKGLYTKSSTSVLSWDFIKNEYCTIPLNYWYLGNWITITEENISLLNEVMKDVLTESKKNDIISVKKQKDKKTEKK